MKIRVKQAHMIRHRKAGELRWIDHPAGQELEIEEKDFCGNLHELVEKKPEIGKPKTEKKIRED